MQGMKKSVVIGKDSIVKNIIGPKMNTEDPIHYFIIKLSLEEQSKIWRTS